MQPPWPLPLPGIRSVATIESIVDLADKSRIAAAAGDCESNAERVPGGCREFFTRRSRSRSRASPMTLLRSSREMAASISRFFFFPPRDERPVYFTARCVLDASPPSRGGAPARTDAVADRRRRAAPCRAQRSDLRS